MKTAKKFAFILLTMLPLAALPQHKPTSWDSDGDGVPDSVDQCVLVPGLPQFNGCPFAPVETADDRDGDGVPDVFDACPDMFGLASNKGCPDLALINQPQISGATSPAGGATANTSSMYNSTSSSEAEQMNSFKDNLLAVLASSGHMFAGIKADRDEGDNDYKTALCLAGADECYIGQNQHFYASYGTYIVLDAALQQYENLKQNLVMALGENKWSSSENIDDGSKSFAMRQKDAGNSFSPRVTAYVKQLSDYTYRVYLTIDSKDAKAKTTSALEVE